MPRRQRRARRSRRRRRSRPTATSAAVDARRAGRRRGGRDRRLVGGDRGRPGRGRGRGRRRCSRCWPRRRPFGSVGGAGTLSTMVRNPIGDAGGAARRWSTGRSAISRVRKHASATACRGLPVPSSHAEPVRAARRPPDAAPGRPPRPTPRAATSATRATRSWPPPAGCSPSTASAARRCREIASRGRAPAVVALLLLPQQGGDPRRDRRPGERRAARASCSSVEEDGGRAGGAAVPLRPRRRGRPVRVAVRHQRGPPAGRRAPDALRRSTGRSARR